ncbi:hypothetical protein BKA69DRAFT_1094090 [Paraphysoderma sedebokerense]|nr:hypothetical protein BKA69DRAFT_1094090 [Paraphysoderma sedebokerense]
MSILSAFLGCTLPNIMSKQYTEILAALLFLVFGVKMIKEGYEMSSDHVTEEMEEVSQELKEKGLEGDKKYDSLEEGLAKKDSDIDLQNDQENDGRGAEKKTQEWVAGFQNLLHYVVSPVFVQTFILTFLAEWGDRSQLATIALAAAGNMYMVIIGTVFGHSLCTGLAVVGGRLLATKISVRTVTICGGVLFVIFGLLTLYYKE